MIYEPNEISFAPNDHRSPIGSEFRESKDNRYYRNNSIISLTLEILNGCEYSCDGCFVNRRNAGVVDKAMINVFKRFKGQGILLDELALGPVSFISAKNTEEVMLGDNFKELSSLFSTIEFNTAILPPWEEELDVDRILYLCSLTDVEYIDLELVIDINLFMSNKEYVDSIKRWQNKILQDKRISTVFLANFVTREEINSYSLKDITIKVNKELNAVFRYNLSFLRVKNEDLMLENLKKFDFKNIDDMRYVNNISNYDSMVNNHITILYENDAYYLSPILNAPTNYTSEALQVDITKNGLSNKIELVSIYNYTNLLYNECNDCYNLGQCIETFRMNIMRDFNVKKCLWNSYKTPLN